MDYSEYFETLDELEDKPLSKVKCCDIIKNQYQHNDIIKCKLCHNDITNIIETPEWRFYGSGDSKSDNPTRCGLPENILLPKSSLGSSIRGGSLNETMNKISRYQRWNSMPYKERSLYKVFLEIDTKCNQHNLTKVISQTAKSLYSLISSTKISRGKNRIGIIAACVYNSCKECNAPRSPNEIAEIFMIENKIMTKGCKQYIEIIRMSKIDISRVQDIRSITLHDFIDRFGYKLNLSDIDISHIKNIADICIELNIINDNTPPSMASGCIYLYIKYKQLDISKKNIGEVCKISEVTINKCSKKIEGDPLIKEYLLLL